MKKILLISIGLIAAGLGLVLYSDPILLTANGGGPQQIAKAPVNGTSGLGNGGPPGNCTTQSGGGVVCGNFSGPGGALGSNAFILTLVGALLCVGGLFLSVVEFISQPRMPFGPKTVT